MAAEDRRGQATYSKGFGDRHDLLTHQTAANPPVKIVDPVNVTLPLNRYNFFEAFKDKLLPNGKISLRLTFDNDISIIFGVLAAPLFNFVVKKLILWIPKITLNAFGDLEYLHDYQTKRKLNYLKEFVIQGEFLDTDRGIFVLTNTIRKPRRIFVVFNRRRDLRFQNRNKFHFGYISNDRTKIEYNVASCRLEINNGEFYPTRFLRPFNEQSKTYYQLINDSFNDYLFGNIVDIEKHKTFYNIIRFDLNNIEEANLIKLHFVLKAAPNVGVNVDSIVRAVILHEQDLEIDGNKINLI